MHYLIRNKLYLYGIKDDRSSFIVCFRVITKKTAEVLAEVLEEAIQNFRKPTIMWIDDGGENTGNTMLNLSREQRIYPITIKPRNPKRKNRIILEKTR